ncbi:MAG: L-fuculokinase, partial [Acutalibacteraceae bacterium]
MIIGGLDVGTTGCKIALYDEKATLLATYYREYEAVHKGGCHEIDFGDIKIGVLSLLKQAANEHKIDALGVTSFGETFAMLDEKDNILAPSMLYTDPRGEKECESLCRAVGEERLTLLSGVKPHPMYSIFKIMWLKNNRPNDFLKCKRILLGEDFIVYTLTGVSQIDYSLSARLGAFDIEKKVWIKEAFDAAGIDTTLMSAPVKAGTAAGIIKPQIKAELGIEYDITVVNGCHDQAAAMIGSGVFNTDQAMDGTGTVECMPVILTEKPADIDFYKCGYSVVPYIGELYACYALSFTGGATLKWFRDNFAELEHSKAQKEGKNVYAELDSTVGDSPTGILVLPHFAGAATPYMDNAAKAAFVGVTLETTKYDLYRALMEGTSYEMLLNFNKMSALTGKIDEIRASGGGATSDIWLQIKADILNSEITALAAKEVGAAGT